MLLSDVEGEVEVVQRVVLGQLRVVEQVGPVPMDQGAERQTVLGREALDYQPVVTGMKVQEYKQ